MQVALGMCGVAEVNAFRGQDARNMDSADSPSKVEGIAAVHHFLCLAVVLDREAASSIVGSCVQPVQVEGKDVVLHSAGLGSDHCVGLPIGAQEFGPHHPPRALVGRIGGLTEGGRSRKAEHGWFHRAGVDEPPPIRE